MTALQAAATSGTGSTPASPAGSSGGAGGGIPGYPGAQFLITIRDRLNAINRDVSALLNRIRATLTPTTTPAPLPSAY